MTAALWLIAVNLGVVALALILISREVADVAEAVEALEEGSG